MDNKNISITLE